MWVIAHRGASGHAPENTIAAFRRAVELGARFMETDLQLSRDARLVAIHDETVERTTNGHGAVSGMTGAELQALDAGAWRGAEFAGQKIPTLEEVLAFAQEKDVSFYLELKAVRMWGAVQSLIGAVQQAKAGSKVVVISFDSTVVEAVVKGDPTLMTGLLFDRAERSIVQRASSIGARQIVPRSDRVTPELLAEARAADLQIVTWTVNKPEEMRRLTRAGVDGIITDYPDRLIALLNEPVRKS